MNAVLVTFILLLFVSIWRMLTFFEIVQRGLHKLGSLTPFLQWYTLLFIGLGYLICRTFWDIVFFEYLRFDFLTDVIGLDKIPGMTDTEEESLMITPWLRKFSLAAPVFGFMAAFVVAEHVYSKVSAFARKTEYLPWRMSLEMNMVLVVIAMPLVFIVMAMRAEIRIWAVMTGSAYLPYLKETSPSMTWEEVKAAEMALYTSDIEMGSFFVFITILYFARLCTNYLRQAPAEYQFTLKWAGLQGVYLYVIFGAIRSLANVAIAFLDAMPHFAYKVQLHALQGKVLDKVTPVYQVATLLCVYNMIILCRMQDIKARLGNANLKFQATRILVLLAQFQLQILVGLTVGSSLYMAAQKLPPQYEQYVKNWHLSVPRAQLMHAALLNVECFLVAVFNRCVWPAGMDYGAVAKAREGKASLSGSLQEQLLTA